MRRGSEGVGLVCVDHTYSSSCDMAAVKPSTSSSPRSKRWKAPWVKTGREVSKARPWARACLDGSLHLWACSGNSFVDCMFRQTLVLLQICQSCYWRIHNDAAEIKQHCLDAAIIIISTTVFPVVAQYVCGREGAMAASSLCKLGGAMGSMGEGGEAMCELVGQGLSRREAKLGKTCRGAEVSTRSEAGWGRVGQSAQVTAMSTHLLQGRGAVLAHARLGPVGAAMHQRHTRDARPASRQARSHRPRTYMTAMLAASSSAALRA